MSDTEGASHTQPTRPLVLPDPFSGDDNFDHWISHFESVSAVNKWTDDDKLHWLRVRFSGKAHVAFNQLPHETYAKTWADFGDDLRRLSDKAFPTLQLEARE